MDAPVETTVATPRMHSAAFEPDSVNVDPPHLGTVHVCEAQRLHREARRIDCPRVGVEVSPGRGYLRQPCPDSGMTACRRVAAPNVTLPFELSQKPVPYDRRTGRPTPDSPNTNSKPPAEALPNRTPATVVIVTLKECSDRRHLLPGALDPTPRKLSARSSVVPRTRFVTPNAPPALRPRRKPVRVAQESARQSA